MKSKPLKRILTENPQNTYHAAPPEIGLSDGQKILLLSLLSRGQLAQRWNCCVHTIARRKDLRPVRLSSRLLRYRLADIEAIEASAIAKENAV